MITTLKIYFRKDYGTRHHIQHIMQPQNGKAILECDLVNPLLSMHIRHDPYFFSVNNAGIAHEIMLSNKTLVYQFNDLSLELSMLSWVHSVMWQAW